MLRITHCPEGWKRENRKGEMRPFYPVAYYSVVYKSSDGYRWYDFSRGEWSGVDGLQCLTSSYSLCRSTAKMLAETERKETLIIPYSLIATQEPELISKPANGSTDSW